MDCIYIAQRMDKSQIVACFSSMVFLRVHTLYSSAHTSGTTCATRKYHILQAAILSKTAAKTSNPTFINFLNNDSLHKTSLLEKKYYKAYKICVFYMIFFLRLFNEHQNKAISPVELTLYRCICIDLRSE